MLCRCVFSEILTLSSLILLDEDDGACFLGGIAFNIYIVESSICKREKRMRRRVELIRVCCVSTDELSNHDLAYKN